MSVVGEEDSVRSGEEVSSVCSGGVSSGEEGSVCSEGQGKSSEG